MPSNDTPQWTLSGESILSEPNLTAVKDHLQNVGNIAVEHWHYLGGRSATPLAFDDFDEFLSYLRTAVRPGDAIDVYPFPHGAKTIARGKYPNANGHLPNGGAY